MNKYINADSLLTKIKAYRPYMYLGEDALSYAIKMVELEPTADVRENVRGEWMDFSMSIKGVPTEACGVCGEWSLGMGKNFCPNCGADMRGE